MLGYESTSAGWQNSIDAECVLVNNAARGLQKMQVTAVLRRPSRSDSSSSH